MLERPLTRHEFESEFRYFYSLAETERQLGLFLIGKEKAAKPPHDLLLLSRLVDMVCHTALQYSELVADHLDAEPVALRKYARAVSEAYRRSDRMLGELMAAFGEGNVVVLSDHGFVLEAGRAGALKYNHVTGPAGIFVAAGPAFRSGRVDGLGVLDVLPLLLHLKGLPVADDLPGHLHKEIFSEAFSDAHGLRRVPSYRTLGGARGVAASSPETNREMLERLRALGYVN
jgi:hypothetical protein